MRTLLIAVVFVLSGSLAHAQPVEPTKQPSLKIPTIIFAGAAAADWTTTYRVQQSGGNEANPMYRWLNGQPKQIAAIGMASDILGAYIWNRYIGRKHRKLAKVGLYGMAALRMVLVVRNIQVANRRAASPGFLRLGPSLGNNGYSRQY